MRNTIRAFAVAAIAAGVCASAADAAPIRVVAPAAIVGMDAPGVVQAQPVAYRRTARAPVRVYGRRAYRGRVYGRRSYDPAGAAIAGAALGLIGAGIASATAPQYDYYPSYGYGYQQPGYGYQRPGYGYYGY